MLAPSPAPSKFERLALSPRSESLGGLQIGHSWLPDWERHQPRRPSRPRLPVRPGDAALWPRRPRPASTVSHELLSSKHKSNSLAGIARTAASGVKQSPKPLNTAGLRRSPAHRSSDEHVAGGGLSLGMRGMQGHARRLGRPRRHRGRADSVLANRMAPPGTRETPASADRDIQRELGRRARDRSQGAAVASVTGASPRSSGLGRGSVMVAR